MKTLWYYVTKFRLPTFSEIKALFLKNRTVAAAGADITGAITRLEDVIAHHDAASQAKGDQATKLSAQAGTLLTEAAAHDAEAAKAAAVSAKLTALVS